jgi:hypothetical protein
MPEVDLSGSLLTFLDSTAGRSGDDDTGGTDINPETGWCFKCSEKCSTCQPGCSNCADGCKGCSDCATCVTACAGCSLCLGLKFWGG